jgi:hypothetical protein
MSDITVSSGTQEFWPNGMDDSSKTGITSEQSAISSQTEVEPGSSQDFDGDGEADNNLPVLAESSLSNSLEANYLAYQLNSQLSSTTEKS